MYIVCILFVYVYDVSLIDLVAGVVCLCPLWWFVASYLSWTISSTSSVDHHLNSLNRYTMFFPFQLLSLCRETIFFFFFGTIN